MATVRVFHTHIEVYPYELGDCPEIEYMMSKYDAVTHQRIPVGLYIKSDILYLPRGFNTMLLEKYFKTEITLVRKCDDYCKISKGVPLYKPKSKIQEQAINFLTSSEEYAYTARYSQLGLNIDTGDGKTYAAITAILKLKIRAIIITHRESLKTQWIKSFKEMTTLPDDRICNISGVEVMSKIMNGKVNADIYCVNHQTITTYASNNGWDSIRDFFKKIKVGIKVIDESHKFFESTLMIDNFSNIYKSFYLTATFTRSDVSEASIFKKSFSSLVRFGEETQNNEEKRKHITFILVYFKSKPEYGIAPNVKTNYGFSSYKYIDYELGEENKTLIKVLHRIIDETSHLEGKTMILSPKKDSVDYIAKDVSEYTGEEVGTIYSKNSISTNNENKNNKRYLSSTIKSSGEGTDIKGLRVLINLEPVASKGLADQVRGRLREYDDEKDTFLFYPVDLTVEETCTMVKRILPVMRKKCKEIKILNLLNI